MNKVELVTFTNIKQIIGKKQLEVFADTVEDLIDKLIEQYGEVFKEELLDKEGDLKKVYRIVVNGRNINLLDGFQTKFKDDDMVVIMPAIAGG
jgi:MoaD family protein